MYRLTKTNYMEIKDSDNLWELFGLQPNSERQEIDNAYLNLRSSHKYNNAELRLAWKILRDPYFSHTYSDYESIRKVLEAGFFDDGVPLEHMKNSHEELWWVTTPVEKIRARIDSLTKKDKVKIKKNGAVILVTTGAFSPIHDAHINMMEVAKEELEKRGIVVVGGYISPSHDDYVSTKYNGNATLSIAHRLRLCEEAVAESSWLMVDSWEGRYNTVPITFTDVLVRTEEYLRVHIKEIPISTVFVFGSDNATFARAFIKRGSCVCVQRPRNEDKVKMITEDDRLSSNNKIIIPGIRAAEKDISSSAIRSGGELNMPEESRELFLKWKMGGEDKSSLNQNIYAIRDDSTWGTSLWLNDSNKSTLESSHKLFVKLLATHIKSSFETPKLPDKPKVITPLILSLSDQQKYIDNLSRSGPVLNLDVCTKSKLKINLSRLFNVSDGQCRSNNLIPRPYFEKPEKQFESIPDGTYTLVDDDIATGRTHKTIIGLLPKRIKIEKTVTLLAESLTVAGIDKSTLLDVVDVRDFIVGSRDGGLVVSLPDKSVVRAPYMLPYVSLSTRAKIPPSQEISLSIDLWKLNLQFFNSIGSTILLENTSPSFQKLMNYIGFNSQVPMTQICKWHIQMLENSTNHK